MAASTIRSSPEIDLYCDPCHNDGDQEQAYSFCKNCQEFLCGSCSKSHRKVTCTRNHILLQKEKMPRTKPESKAELTTKCTDHSQEIIIYYCKNHDKIGCHECMANDHHVCEIELVSDVENTIDESEMTEMMQDIQDIEDQAQNNLNEATAQKVKCNLYHETAINDMKRFRRTVNEQIDKMELELTTDASKINEEDQNAMDTIIHECKLCEKEMKDLREEIEKNKEDRSQIFILMKLNQTKLNNHKSAGSHTEATIKTRTYHFKADPEFESKLQHWETFGRLVREQAQSGESNATQCGNTKVETNALQTVNTSSCVFVAKDNTTEDDEIVVTDIARNKNTEKEMPNERSQPTPVLRVSPLTSTSDGKCLPENTTSEGERVHRRNERCGNSARKQMLNNTRRQGTYGTIAPKEYQLIQKSNEILEDVNIVTNQHRENKGNRLENEQRCGDVKEKRAQNDLNIKHPSDEMSCMISGITMLSDDELVVIDRQNKCIKVIDINTNEIIIKRRLRNSPWDITRLEENKIAVTFPKEMTIHFYNPSRRGILDSKSLEVVGRCAGIHCYRDNLYVSYEDSNKIEILSMEGNVKKVVSPCSDSLDKLINPKHLTVSPDGKFVYVTDWNTHSVFRLPTEGGPSVSCHFENFYPTVVEMSENGSVIVCDRAVPGSICLLSADLSKKDILDTKNTSILSPFAVCVYRNKKLFVSCIHESASNRIFELELTSAI